MNFAALLDLHARSDPDGLALVDDPTSRSWSWSELLEAVVGAQRGLDRLGLRAGDRIGFLTYNRPEFVILFTAALRAGIVPALYNVRWGPTDLSQALEDCEPKALLCDPALAEPLALPALAGADWGCRLLVAPDEGQEWAEGDLAEVLIASEGELPRPLGRGNEDLAEIMYTSGSTGRPKGVLHHHGHHFANAFSLGDHFRLSRRDVCLVTFPLFHQSGQMTWGIAFSLGAPLILARCWRTEEFARLVRDHGITFTHLITNVVNELASCEEDAGQSLRVTVYGGGQTTEAQALAFERHFGTVLCSGYGRSEGGFSWELPDPAKRRFDRNGLPLRGTAEIRVVGPDGEPVPDGEDGEIRMRGDAVARGYWQRPDLNAEVFDEQGFMRTNDVGRFDEEGGLTFKGRADRMIKSGGENVHPAEVEEVLLRMPGIVSVAVVGVSDQQLSERICAAVVVSDEKVDADAVDAYCRERLAGFKRPRSIAIMEKLPTLGSEKVDFQAVAALLEGGGATIASEDTEKR